MASGMYFLANDSVINNTIAFLNSVRMHNPSLPICLIPFNDDCERVMRLHARYDFSIWSDCEVLRRCDEISLSFHNRVLGHYRKLALWEGGFTQFVYIDTDTVI